MNENPINPLPPSRKSPVSTSDKPKTKKKGHLRGSNLDRSVSVAGEGTRLEVPEPILPVGKRKLSERKSKKEDRKRLLIETAYKINPETGNKVTIICSRQSSSDVLKKLEENLEILTNSPNNQEAENMISSLFCPVLAIGVENIPEKYYPQFFIVERAKFIASLLLDDRGNIDRGMIKIIKELINKNPLLQHFSKIHNKILIKILDALQSNEELIDLLNGIEEPGKNLNKLDPQKKYIESLIRATLGLKEEDSLTARDSKLAILSSMLMDLRQGSLGSCYATSVAIMVHDQNPLQLVKELKQMIEGGKFQKIFRGRTTTFNMPTIGIPLTLAKKEDYFAPTGWYAFVNNPGIQYVASVAGININQDPDRSMCRAMFNAALEAASEQGNKSALLRQFIHQLAMHKAGLERDDFKNRDQYEKLILEKSKLTEQLAEAQADSEKEMLIESLKVIQQELDNLNSYFNTKFGVGVSLKTRFEAYDDYRKKFEIYFLATRENVLLSTWELSLTTAGGAAINVFCSLISRPPNTGIIDYIMNPMLKAMEWSKWALSLGMYYNEPWDSINLVCLLDEILNKIEDSNFNRTKFMKEFSTNFHKKFNERIEQRLSGGVMTMYDKTRNLTSIDLSKPLTDAQSMCEAIFSVAYQVIEDMKIENPIVKEKIIHELSIAIQGEPNSDSKKSKFFLNLMSVWLQFFGSGSIESDLVKREKQFWESFATGGGRPENTLNDYLGKSYTKIQLSRDPKSFIKQLVTQLNKMMQNGMLDNIDPEVEIIFPMQAPGHVFLLRPDMAMLAEVMKNPDPKAVETWITKTLIDDRKTFFVADLNWKEAKGEHAFLAIRKNLNTDKLELIILDEHENVVEVDFQPTEFSVFFLTNS